jgi:hypothetical protein
LGTPPRAVSQSLPDPINYHAPESASIEHPRSVSSHPDPKGGDYFGAAHGQK